jgi:hypothetical protein
MIERTNIKTPKWYAVRSIVFVPIVAVASILVGIVLLLLWPVIPILCLLSKDKTVTDVVHTDESGKMIDGPEQEPSPTRGCVIS